MKNRIIDLLANFAAEVAFYCVLYYIATVTYLQYLKDTFDKYVERNRL